MYLACSVVYTKLANPGSYQCLLFPETTLSLENDSWLAADDDWPQISSKGGSQVTMNDDERMQLTIEFSSCSGEYQHQFWKLNKFN